ncbi:MAG: hypothetical protein A3H98_10840 [Bacteroidetes bacterium RIFCSPLOWO2_02_FULL_36_8]|nr:MAG: hypothetical protein A3H98_10840 [Bacteroidetes bacterium RIFCSPLOWO2_02_FULL_36_8]
MLNYTYKPQLSKKVFSISTFYFFLVFTNFPLPTAYCQLQKIDSLLSLLKSDKEDTNKVNHLNAIAWHFRIVQSGEAGNYIEKGFSLTKKINFKKGEANLHHTNASLFYNKGDYGKALVHSKKALNIRQLIGDKAGIATSYNNIGNINKDLGNFPVALKNYKTALKFFTELKDKKNTSNTYGNIGIIYWSQGNYPEALKYYFMALKNFEELNDRQGIASSHNNIGGIYWSQGNIDDALKNYLITLKLYEETGQKNGNLYSNTLNNIGLIYWNKSNYTEALKNYGLSLKISEEMGEKKGTANTYNNIGLIYRDLKNHSEALKNYHHALEIRQEIGDKTGIANTYSNIGSILASQIRNLPDAKTRQVKYSEARNFLQKGRELAIETGSMEFLRDAYSGLSDLEKEISNYKDAYLYFKLYSQTRDSLFSEEKSKEIGKLQAKHEYELAEVKRIQQDETSRRQKIAEVSRRNTLQYSGILIFLVFIFAGILFSGKLHIPLRVAEGLIFFVFLLLFEFILVWMDPFIESLTGGEPLYKLLINALVASVIFPLHNLLEKLMRRRLI